MAGQHRADFARLGAAMIFIRSVNTIDQLDPASSEEVSRGVVRWLRARATETREKAEQSDDRSERWSLLTLARAYDGRAEHVEATIASRCGWLSESA